MKTRALPDSSNTLVIVIVHSRLFSPFCSGRAIPLPHPRTKSTRRLSANPDAIFETHPRKQKNTIHWRDGAGIQRDFAEGTRPGCHGGWLSRCCASQAMIIALQVKLHNQHACFVSFSLLFSIFNFVFYFHLCLIRSQNKKTCFKLFPIPWSGWSGSYAQWTFPPSLLTLSR